MDLALTVIEAKVATVMKVPKAIANVASVPEIGIELIIEKLIRINAPLQGLKPIESTA